MIELSEVFSIQCLQYDSIEKATTISSKLMIPRLQSANLGVVFLHLRYNDLRHKNVDIFLLTEHYESISVLKWNMGVHKNTSNSVVWADTGRYPLVIELSKQVYNYMERLKALERLKAKTLISLPVTPTVSRTTSNLHGKKCNGGK